MADETARSLGRRLRMERERLHWTQAQLAEHLSSSVPSINRWEQGKTIPRPHMFRVLIDLFGRPPEQWGRTVRWSMPFLRNPYFTGRERLLLHLHQALAAEQTVASGQIRAVSGLGGVGKTQTAIEYVYRYAHEYEAVLWVRADSRETLIADVAGLATALDLPERREREQFRVVAAVKRWLQEHGSWLFVVDNVDDDALLHEVLPRQIGGAVLLTTRAQTDWPYVKKLALESMSQEEGVTFLLRRIASDTTVQGQEDRAACVSESERSAAQLLWERMEGLPLALDQAGAYIKTSQCSLAEYVELYRHHRQILLRERGGAIPEHPEAVATTWALSLQRVEQRCPGAADLLRLSAFLGPHAIPEELLSGGSAYFPPALQLLATSALSLNQAIGTLRAYSLIQRDPARRLLAVHRLVQAVVQDALSEKEKQRWAERAMLAVHAIFPQIEHGLWPQCERLLPYALLVTRFIERYRMERLEAGRLLHQVAMYLQSRARFAEAELLFQRALALREQRLGPEHPEVATSLNDLANFFCEQGRYARAQSFYQRALAIRERHLGPEHPEVATSLHELANLHRLLGAYIQAETLFQQALQIRERCLGAGHPLVAFSQTGLATLYWEMGRYIDAERLFQQALLLRERLSGPDHPDVAYTLNNLACVYVDQGRYTEAARLYQRVLCIREQHLGADHPDLAHPLNNLAEVFYEQGRHAEAELLFRRALRLWERHLGAEHPQVAHPLCGLAHLSRAQGNESEAESLYRRALAIREQRLGQAHPSVASPLHGLAHLCWQQGRLARAEALFQRALQIRVQALGSQHPQVASPLNDLAALYAEQGKYAEAELLYHRALQIWEGSLGCDHANVSHALHGLSNLYRDQGHYEQAERCYMRTLRIREHALSSDDAAIADTLYEFAVLREAQGKHLDAASLCRRALVIREHTFDQDHPKTVMTRQRLTALLCALGQPEGATAYMGEEPGPE